MSLATTVAAVIVGLAFLLAGASKVAAGPGWPATAIEMGAPRFTIPFVPWVELAVGAGLLVQVAMPIPAIAAVVLLFAFTALIVVRLRQGRRPSCACFGAWSAEPIGRVHLVRNAILLALAVFAAF